MILIRYYRRCQPTIIECPSGSVVTYTEDLKQRRINHGEWLDTTESNRQWFMDTHLEVCLDTIDPTP